MKTTQTKSSARQAISAAGTSRRFPWPPVRGAIRLGLRLLLASLALGPMSLAQAQEYTFTTLAGPPEVGPGAIDGPGSAARFYLPFGVAVDSAGNVYAADTCEFTNEPRHILRTTSSSFSAIIIGQRLGALAVDNARAGYTRAPMARPYGTRSFQRATRDGNCGQSRDLVRRPRGPKNSRFPFRSHTQNSRAPRANTA